MKEIKVFDSTYELLKAKYLEIQKDLGMEIDEAETIAEIVENLSDFIDEAT